MIYTIYCDGSTRGNGYEGAVGAWAYIIMEGESDHRKVIFSQVNAVDDTTNQRMELTAAIEALNKCMHDFVVSNVDKVVVYTDSAYLHNCYTQKWYRNWQLNGWVNSKKQPVANQDLWEILIKWFETPEIEFMKTKGHADDQLNNLVDSMAQNASALRKKERENACSGN